MKKAFFFCLTIVTCLLLTGCNTQNNSAFLEEKYYGQSDFIELDKEKLNTLIDSKETFAIFIHQPYCSVSVNFENVLKEFATTYQISFYKMAFTDLKDTELGNHIKYYPSFAIYEKGKMIDCLDANSDEDTEIYENVENFKKWFSKYIEIEFHK